MKTKLIIGLIVLLVLVSGCIDSRYIESKPDPMPQVQVGEEQLNCIENGGVWEIFPTCCVDKCDCISDCAYSPTKGCDCGEDKCWNGEKCVENPKLEEIKKEREIYTLGKQEIFLDEIAIGFNGKKNNGLNASSVLNVIQKPFSYEINDEFREYFLEDVRIIISSINGIENVETRYWFTSTNAVSISIIYKDNLTIEEKKKNLDKFKEELEIRWYTDYAEYDSVLHMN